MDPAFAATSAGLCINGISLDHPNQQIDKDLAFLRREWLENTGVGSPIAGEQATAQLYSGCGQMELSRTPIPAIHAPLDQPHRLQLVDYLAGVNRNDAKGLSETTLVYTRYIVDAGHHHKLQLREPVLGKRIADDRRANLLKAARQIPWRSIEHERH
jgi:hypothetical protein